MNLLVGNTYIHTMDPSSAEDQLSSSWLHQLEPELVSSAACPEGLQPRSSSGHSAPSHAHTQTHRTPPLISPRDWLYPAAGPGWAGLPATLHTDANCSLVAGSGLPVADFQTRE